MKIAANSLGGDAYGIQEKVGAGANGSLADGVDIQPRFILRCTKGIVEVVISQNTICILLILSESPVTYIGLSTTSASEITPTLTVV